MTYNGHANYETWAVSMFLDGNYDGEGRCREVEAMDREAFDEDADELEERERWLENDETKTEPYDGFEEVEGEDPLDAVYVYHRAPTEDRARIKAHGLLPSLPTRNPHWHENEEGSYVQNQPQGVYVSADPAGFKSGSDIGNDYWRARVNPENLYDDPIFKEDEAGRHYWHDRAIPPEHLELHQPYEGDTDVWPTKNEPLPGQHPEDWTWKKDYEQNKGPWGIGQPTAKYMSELVRFADSWNPKDQWPTALRDRAGLLRLFQCAQGVCD